MKLKYDKEADAVYLSFVEIGPGDASMTIELSERMALDFNKKGKLLGVEFLDASKIFPKKLLYTSKKVFN